jgi:hypothetical protein
MFGFRIGFEVMIAFPLQRDSGTRAARNRNFSRGLPFSCAEALVAAGLERLSADYRTEAKEKLFSELRIFLTSGADPPPTYAELAVRLGATESTLRRFFFRRKSNCRYCERGNIKVKQSYQNL